MKKNTRPFVLLVLLIIVIGCTQTNAPPVNDQNNFSPPALPSPDNNAPPNQPPATNQGSILVRVQDNNGNPLPRVIVEFFIENEEADEDAYTKIAEGETNAQGQFELTDLNRGEIYVTAADRDHNYQPTSGEVESDGQNREEILLRLRPILPPPPNPEPPPNVVQATVESDDDGFYPSTLTVPINSTLRLLIKQHNTHSAFGGADFKSSAFPTINIPKGQEKMVTFMVNAETKIESFWPSSNVKKAELIIQVE